MLMSPRNVLACVCAYVCVARADESADKVKELDTDLEQLRRDHATSTRDEGGAQDKVDALEMDVKKLKDVLAQLERKCVIFFSRFAILHCHHHRCRVLFCLKLVHTTREISSPMLCSPTCTWVTRRCYHTQNLPFSHARVDMKAQ